MEGKEEEAPSHHPPAPPSELFNVHTTIDPGYIISLIRKLLPRGATHNCGSQDASAHGSPYCSEEQKDLDSCHGGPSCGDNGNGSMETFVGFDSLSHQKSKVDEDGEKANLQFADVENCRGTPVIGDRIDEEGGFSQDASDNNRASTEGDPWEESGCILWDLAANETHAEFMVENLLLEVLLANLNVSESVRVKEICLGIIGNLACHEVPRNAITSTKGLIQSIIDQLFLDDSVCLSETCRLLTSCLQGGRSVNWAEALVPEHILCRIIWIAGNTLSSQLLVKCLELLLAVLDNQEVARILLPPLMKLELPNVLLNLLACEMNSLSVGKEPERCSALELILCVIESLSTTDNYSKVISSDNKLFRLVYAVVKLPDKVEVLSSCVTAVVLIANVLTDEPSLVSEISQDMPFLQGLLDILPFVADDSQARSALWSVLARMLVRVEVNSMSQSSLQQYASVLIDKSELIEDDLDDHQIEDSTEDHRSSNSAIKQSDSKLCRIVDIINQWMTMITTRDASNMDFMARNSADEDARVQKLLQYCRRHIM